MGNQGQSYQSTSLLKAWLDDGAIGQVREVDAWTDRPVGGDPVQTIWQPSVARDDREC
jgi:hypothetical protein